VLGVGPEQNFTYDGRRPQMAFIIDIRRATSGEHLFYKALLELSADRPGFFRACSRARGRPASATRRLASCSRHARPPTPCFARR
jgi:hypothetical protein